MKRRFMVTAVTAGLALGPAPSQAQSGAGQDVTVQNLLEEVLVTAQKREQNLREVPISMAVFSGADIERLALLELEDLSAQSPAFTVTEAAIATQVFVRGLGSGINQGFEQSVGMFIDGVYAGRGRQYRSSFLDVERVELLRGPQGILFGKNTIAGAINVINAQPTAQPEAYLSVRGDLDHGERMFTAVWSGPLADNWSARVAAKTGGFDGWLYNTPAQRDEAGVDESVVRGTLRWDATDMLDATLKLEHSSYTVDGRTTQITEQGPYQALFRAFDPAFEDRFDQLKSTAGIGLERSKTNQDLATLTANLDWQDMLLTSITAWSAYDYLDELDVDFGPVPYLFQTEPQDFSQFSQELRLASAPGGPLEFVAGAYFESSDLDNTKALDADLVWLGLPLPAATRFTEFDQDTRSWALFGQATWHLDDRLRLTAGLRYTDERKTAGQSMWFADFRTNVPNGPLGDAYASVGFGVPHDYLQRRSESHWSPSLGLQFDLSESTNFYATLSNGFKAGGFNEAEQTGDIANFEFENEESTSVEAGVKMLLADGAARLDLALFHTSFKDLQVSSFEGVSFVVGNAAEATSQGLELDGQWRLGDAWLLSGSWTVLDSTYDDFRNAACTIEQTIASGIGGRCVQDLTGRTTQFAPRNSGRIALGWEHFLGNGQGLDATLAVVHSDGFYIEQDLDPNEFQPAYQKLDLQLGWTSPGGAWRASLLARNLTDELTRHHGSDVPLLAGAHYSMTDRPRSYTLQVSRYF